MNVFDVINSFFDLYIGYFWFLFPLTFYLGFEISQWKTGQTSIPVWMYKKYKAWRMKDGK